VILAQAWISTVPVGRRRDLSLATGYPEFRWRVAPGFIAPHLQYFQSLTSSDEFQTPH